MPRKMQTEAQVGDPKTQRVYLVQYDIPSGGDEKGKKIANPSDVMKRWGFRMTYSCWAVPEKNIPLLPLAEIRDKGAKVRMVRFDESEYDVLIQMAKDELGAEVGRVRKLVKTTLAGIKDRYDLSVKTRDPKHFDTAYAYNYINMRRIKGYLESAQECAMAFDLTGDFTELFDGLRACIAAADTQAMAAHQEAEKKVRP